MPNNWVGFDYIPLIFALLPFVVVLWVALFKVKPEDINPRLGISEAEVVKLSIRKAEEEYNKLYGGK